MNTLWPTTRGPLPILRGDAARQARPRWVDHARRERTDNGSWRYITEPYELDADAITDLAHLVACGWDVTVTATDARHLPGHTLAVTLEEIG